MNNSGKNKPTPARRKSDLTLLGTSSQDLGDKVYTLEFGVNLSQISFEGLNKFRSPFTVGTNNLMLQNP